MRKIVLVTYLFTLLLTAGNKMHANVPTVTIDSYSNWKTPSDNKVQFTSLGRTNLLIEYSDFDLDEEFSGSNDYRESRSNQLLKVKQCFFDKWYLTYIAPFNEAYCRAPFFRYKPLNGQSTPIYITQSVLRI
jgi:hypothetical protein